MIFALQKSAKQGDKLDQFFDKLTDVTNWIGGEYLNIYSHLVEKIQFVMTNWMTNLTDWKFVNDYSLLSDFPVCHTTPSPYGRECPCGWHSSRAGRECRSPFINHHDKEGENCMIILALDLGTNTGWALSQSSNITSGSQSFKPGRFEGGGMRYLRFQSWLQEMNSLAGGIEMVCFEEVRRHMGVDAAHAYGGFLSQLSSWCEAEQIPYQGIPVGTIKKHITGKGNASKAQMIKAVEALGFNPVDDNEADALALLNLAKSQFEGEAA